MTEGGDVPRLFTLEEATALLPRLRTEVAALREGSREVAVQRRRLAALERLPRSNGHPREAEEVDERLGVLLGDLGRRVEALTALGVEVKDLEQGLIDFPSLREGRVVYLCWRVDEERIAYWHELDAGYQGRQPL